MNENKNFKPVVPAHKRLPEFTPVSLMLGLLLAVVFGAANAYLGLRVGMTVSASIPAAVLSMGILRYILRRDSILENNMVQTIGSAGESLAAGAIFTMPALFMWAQESTEVAMPSFTEIAAVSVCGGLLGVLFMVPLRRALIVEEHGALPFPEGTACAEVLLAGEEGGAGSKVVFAGLGLSALYKFITEGLQLFPSRVHWNIRPLRTGIWTGCTAGTDRCRFYLWIPRGVQYVCRRRAWLVCIDSGDHAFRCGQCDRTGHGGDLFDGRVGYLGQLYPLYRCGSCCSRRYYQSDQNVSGDPSYLRRCNERDRRRRADTLRTSKELPMGAVLAGILLIAVVIWLLPSVPVRLFGAMLVVIFGFFFATVSSRMVGLVGSSNNPVSGMAIATLLIATALLKGTGMTGYVGMVSAICVGTVICIVAAMAGDTSQDLKTGYIVGATPLWQQIGELIGAVVAALTIGGVMYLLNARGALAIPCSCRRRRQH